MYSTLTYKEEKELADFNGRLPTCNCGEIHYYLRGKEPDRFVCPDEGSKEMISQQRSYVVVDRVLRKDRCGYCGGHVYWMYSDSGELEGIKRSLLKSIYLNHLKTGILRKGEIINPSIFFDVDLFDKGTISQAKELVQQGYVNRREGYSYTGDKWSSVTYELTSKGLKLFNRYLFKEGF